MRGGMRRNELFIEKIKIIQNLSNIPISVDTCRASVAKDALELGIDVINDISGLKYDPNMPKIIEKYKVGDFVDVKIDEVTSATLIGTAMGLSSSI